MIEVTHDEEIDVKKIDYKLGELFTGLKEFELNSHNIEKLKYDKANNLYLIKLFLPKGNYHRYHAPVDMIIKARNHIAGHIRKVEGENKTRHHIFEENERLIIYGQWMHGFISMVFIAAAWEVGSMTLECDPTLNTTKRLIAPQHIFDIRELPDGKPDHLRSVAIPELMKTEAEGIKVKKGDEIGHFIYGSEIAMIIEAPLGFEFVVKAGDRTFYGSPLGSTKSSVFCK